MNDEKSNIITYTIEDGLTKIETTFSDETIWLTQAQIADLFQKSVSTISRHINNVFNEGELDKKAICIFCKLQIQINQ